jgi:hypothetical protein
LKRVLGIMVVDQRPAANAPDHRRMSTNEFRQGLTVAQSDKSLQQLAVGLFGLADLFAELAYRFSRHDRS